MLCIAALYFVLPIFLGSFAQSTISSYLTSVACFFLLTFVSAKLILGERKYVRFYSIAFFVQLIIGLFHYLYFVDTNYFNTDGSGSTAFWHEYLSVFDAISRLQDGRNQAGILYWMDSSEFQVTHTEIWHIISYPFYFLNHRWLNYAPLNVFASLVISMNIMFLFLRKVDCDKDMTNHLLYWTAFFPQFLLNGTVWRDPFGIMLVTIGLVLVTLSNSTVTKAFSFIAFASFSFLQRTMYVVLACVSSFWGYFQKTRSIIAKIIYIVIGFLALSYLGEAVEEVNGAEYNAMYINVMSYLALPIKIIFGMIGPFPWTQFSTLVSKNPAFAWQLADYVTGTFQLGYLFAIVFKWKQFSFRKLDALTVMGFGIMLGGFMSKQLHIGYISEGVLLTLPWFFTHIRTEYKKFFKLSLLALIGLNFLLLAMGNMGIGNIWK